MIDVINGNKLIAKFMGGEFKEDLPYTWTDSGWVKTPANDNKTIAQDYDFKYHNSWEWIMPVVEKIELLTGNFRIVNNIAIIDGNDEDGAIKDFDEKIIGEDKFEATYKMVVKFIEWYNKK